MDDMDKARTVDPNASEDAAVDWSKRQFIVGTTALGVVGAVALFGGSAVASATRAIVGSPVDQGVIHLYQGDYFFLPNYMTWRVGDTLTVVLHNLSSARFHEWMTGRGVDPTPTVFGPIATQFKEDFWNGVHVTIEQADGVDNFVTNKAIVTSDVGKPPWLITEPDQGHFSPTLKPGGQITLKFTVPNKPGVWHYGCFVQGYIHYLAGMRGTINILDA